MPHLSLTRASAVLLAFAFAFAASPGRADAQLGRLKRIKNAVRPDSAARAASVRNDTLTATVAPTTAAAKPDRAPRRSRMARAASAAGKASARFEEVTGVSAKDAALVATGAGAGTLVAKKLGVDPTSIASKAVAQAAGSSPRRALSAQSRRAQPPAMAGMLPSMAAMLDPSRMGAAPRSPASAAMPGFPEADAQAMVAFQQEMMQVAMAASAGDVKAQARLEAWNAIVLKYQPEIEQMTLTAQAGDLTAMHTMQRMQPDMMRDWSRTSRTKQSTRVVGAKIPRP